MKANDEISRRIDRRTVLRRTGALSAGLLSVGVLGTPGAADEQSTLTFEADPTAVPGLESAVVRVDAERETVRHDYAWDPEAVADLDAPPRASLRLELPELELTDPTAVLDTDPTAVLDLERVARSTAVVTEVTSPTDDSVRAELADDTSTASSDGDLLPYAETTSPLCGTLAETTLGISRANPSAHPAYDAVALDTNTYDYTCEDEWYVHPRYDTQWFEDASSVDREPRAVTASATYYNDDFPESDRVWADHEFDVTPSSHDLRCEHSGDWSKFLLELKSETGYRR